MAEGIATRSSRGHRTICLPIEEEDYLRIIHDPKAFRRTLDDCFRQTPELFPVNFALGYELKDDRMSAKQQIPIRRILLKDDSAYSIRPSFLMPYMTARTADVEGPLFLRKFGVPFWALARVFGGDPMSWYRMECGLGRFSVVGTTVRTATLPEHLGDWQEINYLDHARGDTNPTRQRGDRRRHALASASVPRWRVGLVWPVFSVPVSMRSLETDRSLGDFRAAGRLRKRSSDKTARVGRSRRKLTTKSQPGGSLAI